MKKDRRKFLKDAASLPCAFVLMSVAGPLESLAKTGPHSRYPELFVRVVVQQKILIQGEGLFVV